MPRPGLAVAAACSSRCCSPGARRRARHRSPSPRRRRRPRPRNLRRAPLPPVPARRRRSRRLHRARCRRTTPGWGSRSTRSTTSPAGSDRGRARRAAYFRAADWVEEQFRASGWEVRRQRLPHARRVLMGRAGAGGAVGQRDRDPRRRTAREALAARRRAPRHGAAGPGRRGQRVRRRRPAHPRRRARRPPLAVARDAGRLRLGGAARADRRRPPLRVARVRRVPHARPAWLAARDGLDGPGRRGEHAADREHRRAVVAAGRAGRARPSGPTSTS